MWSSRGLWSHRRSGRTTVSAHAVVCVSYRAAASLMADRRVGGWRGVVRTFPSEEFAAVCNLLIDAADGFHFEAELWRGSQLYRGILTTTLVLGPQVLGGEPSSNPPTIRSQIFISTW